MKARKAGISVLFFAMATTAFAQETKNDTIKNEKKIEGVIIQGKTGKETETSLLNEQKKSVEMKQSIGAQELSRKGVGDAAAAVIKTTGVAKQEGVNNVFVRGLGDRYNSTTLNGLPLPSENPVYKNISLDFFQSSIIKNININKTFNAEISGDAGGANIDISSKELDRKYVLSISVGNKFNINALEAGSKFVVADGAFSYFGFPKNGTDVPIKDLKIYSFNSKFQTQQTDYRFLPNFSVFGGAKINLGGKQSLSLFAVAANDTEFSYKEGFVGQSTVSGDYTRRDEMQKSGYKTTQTVLGNVKYSFGKGSVAVNSLFIHDNSQYVNRLLGFDDDINDNLGTPAAEKSLRIRQQMNNNNLFSNQILADYKFSSRIKANVGAVYSMIRGSEPDRKINTYAFNDTTNQYHVASSSNNRFFSTLDENDFGVKAGIDYTFNPKSELPVVLSLGGDYRNTDRTFRFTQFIFEFNGGPSIDPNNPDAVFNQKNLSLGASAGGFDLGTGRGTLGTPLDPFLYLAHRDIGAGYAQVVYPVNQKLTAQIGVRYENVQQRIDWDTNLPSSLTDLTVKPSIIDKRFVLPSLNLKYNFNDKNALRFAASETYTMPQFKEMAKFLYEDENNNEYGNPYLIPSTNYNFDLKYDWYLSKKEIISVGTFYKRIQNPISRIQIASSANDYSYVNTDQAFVTGAELDLRKTLISFDNKTRNNDLSFGFNASYLYSEQTQNDNPNDELTTIFTHDKGKMQGASPLLMNADLSFNTSNNNTSFISTVVLNYFYDKVYTVGTLLRENIIEKSVPTLDLVNRYEFKKYKIGINFGVKNILNPEYRLMQQTTNYANNTTNNTLISSYRKGVTAFFGFNWTL